MSTTARSVALLLSQLHAGDRRWLLEQLEPEQRRRIGPELDAVLRLPRATRKREAARLAPAGQPTIAPAAAAGAAADEMAPLIDRIDRLDEAHLTAVWRGSPAWLLQSFLAIHPWRASAALHLLEPSPRSAPQAGTPLPALVRRGLLEAVLAAAEGGVQAAGRLK